VSDLITRRKFLEAAAGALGANLIFSTACNRKQEPDSRSKELNIYNWADYIHPDAVPEFERRYGIHVNYDTFASNEALLAKLQAGATKYDIVVPSNFILAELTKLDLLQAIDHARLTNLNNLMPRFLSPSADTGLKNSVPYMWGTTGIAYNLDAVKRILAKPGDLSGFEEQGWGLFWDKRFSGRMTLLDDERETIGMSLKRLGYSYNSHDREQIKAGKDELLLQKPLIMCYTSDQVIVQLASGDSWLALAYSGDVYQAARSNKAVHYFIPRQGTSIWVDSFAIPKHAPHPDAAYLWIDFMLEPKVAARNAEFTRYATPNKLGFAALSENVKSDKNLYPPADVIDRCEQVLGVGDLAFFYDRMWTELKCA
jgi:spermidine/putrescine transport system substrate-binding protein